MKGGRRERWGEKAECRAMLKTHPHVLPSTDDILLKELLDNIPNVRHIHLRRRGGESTFTQVNHNIQSLTLLMSPLMDFLRASHAILWYATLFLSCT